MIDSPAWFRQLKWSEPLSVSALSSDRTRIPGDSTGCYAFTIGTPPIAPGRVLYIGEAANQSLRKRIAGYLVNFRVPVPKRGADGVDKPRAHKGKGFILEARKKKTDHGVYLRWIRYGADAANVHILEASLINYLNPRANDRVEEHRHPLLGDGEKLDRRLIG
ncbi:MAG: hypothetical protein JWN85_2369 [Gammaproteobacteria bacterium]|nr:hypothetical protein [Gammaproteobacteria bacterium]